jgi:hypothetical protein
MRVQPTPEQLRELGAVDQESPLTVRPRRSSATGSEPSEGSNTSGSETGEDLKGIEEQDDEE